MTGPVIVPRNFHSMTRVLTNNMYNAVANKAAVCTDPFSVEFIPLPFKNKQTNKPPKHPKKQKKNHQNETMALTLH